MKGRIADYTLSVPSFLDVNEHCLDEKQTIRKSTEM